MTPPWAAAMLLALESPLAVAAFHCEEEAVGPRKTPKYLADPDMVKWDQSLMLLVSHEVIVWRSVGVRDVAVGMITHLEGLSVRLAYILASLKMGLRC